MADLSDFKRRQVVGARMADARVKNAELFDVTRNTLPKVTTAFEKDGKTSSMKQNSGRKRKLSNKDRRTLTRIVKKDLKNTAQKITAELNDHLKNKFSQKL